jgi:hypothetical protein
MPTIVTRETGVTSKDAPLTNAEVDANFINLNQAIVDIVAIPLMEPGTWNWTIDEYDFYTSYTFKIKDSTTSIPNKLLINGSKSLSGGNSGGPISITGGAGLLSPGGTISIFGGSANGVFAGGSVTIQGGNSGNIAAAGGDVNIATGKPVSTGPTGVLKLKTYTKAVVTIAGSAAAPALGFYDTTPVTKPAVTGSKASGAALDSLLAALSSLGLLDTSGVTA